MITYVRGDATNPLGSGPKCIIHIVNDIGKWGRGFVMALSKKWPKTREEYLEWYHQGETFGPEMVLYSEVTKDIRVAHMVAQHGIGTGSKGPPIRYQWLESCLGTVGDEARMLGWTIHMPRIGTGLAQGNWCVIEPIIQEQLRDVPVFVYDYDR